MNGRDEIACEGIASLSGNDTGNPRLPADIIADNLNMPRKGRGPGYDIENQRVHSQYPRS